MFEISANTVVKYAGYQVEAAAVEIDTWYYPQFRISRHGQVVVKWERPQVNGFDEASDAIFLGVKLGMQHIEGWLSEMKYPAQAGAAAR